MKKNKYVEKEQLIRKLDKELDHLYDIKRNMSWIEYDKPIKKGKIISYTLRDDILKSPIGEELLPIVEKSYSSVHLTRDDYHKWIKQGKPSVIKYKRKKHGINTLPQKNTFNKLNEQSPQIKYFTKKYNKWYYSWVINIPEYYLKIKIENWYITHYKEIDPDVESKIAYLENRIDNLSNNKKWWKTMGSHKWYQRNLNKKNRQITKQNIKRVIYGVDEYFYDTRKKWSWWDIY